MKKLIAMLACLTLLVTAFAGLSVNAAGAEIYLEVVKNADETVKYIENAGATYVQVKVNYKNLTGLVAYTSEEDFLGNLSESVTGISSLQFDVVSSDASFSAFATAGNIAFSGFKANAAKNGGVFNQSEYSKFVTASSGTIATMTFLVGDETKATNLSLGTVKFFVKSVVANEFGGDTEYSPAKANLTLTGCDIPAKQAAAPTEYTITTSGANAFIDAPATVAVATPKANVTVKPALGYTITKVEANTTDITSLFGAQGGTAEVTFDADTEIKVTTAAIDTASKPAATLAKVHKEAAVTGTNPADPDFGKEVKAAYQFGKIAAGTANVTEFGARLLKEDGSPVVTLGRPEGYYASTAVTTVGNAFGIEFRALPVGTYKTATYAKIDGEYVVGDYVTFVVE